MYVCMYVYMICLKHRTNYFILLYVDNLEGYVKAKW